MKREVWGVEDYIGEGKEREMVKIWEKKKEGDSRNILIWGNIVKSVCYCWTRCLEHFKTEKRGIIIN